MTRQDYIAGLEGIRKQVKQIGTAFAAVDLTDATNMESDRHKKTKKLVADLCDRLYEDIAISAKVAADNAEAGIGEQGDLFDDAAKAAKAKKAATPKAEEAEVVEVKMLDAPKPLALPAPADDPFNGAAHLPDGDEPKPSKKRGKKSDKGGKGKKNGKKGGAK